MVSRILGLVTARGGSKGVPGKNIKLLLGKPLIAYIIESAKKSGVFDKLIVSTEDEQIASIARDYECETPFMRPKELAEDKTPHLPVAQHAVAWLRDNQDYRPDFVMILQPTSPLIQPFHIKEAVELILKNKSDSVLPVYELPENFNPERNLMIEQNGLLKLFNGDPVRKRPARRQGLRKIYCNTCSFYLFRTELLFDSKEPNFFGDRVIPYVIDKKYVVDINEPEDWQKAEDATKNL
ncbi:acylneuraminate cytidylyltransferase family protein [Patescibacteria group bacterium]|nr:acylneuraminate cytidylyltransferase family protein [Patescibacteria group bacterium]